MNKTISSLISVLIALILLVPFALSVQGINNLQDSYSVNETELLKISLNIDSQTPYTFNAFALPQNAQLINHNNNSATLQFLPSSGQNGEYMIIIRATPNNNQSPTIERTTMLKVLKTNSAPQIVQYAPLQNTVSMQQGTKQTFIVVAVDNDQDQLSYEWKVNGQVAGLSNVLEYTAALSATGSQTIEARVTDGTYASTKSWTVNIEQVNLLPILIEILSPKTNIQSKTAILSLTTSRDSECRAGEKGKSFAELTSLRVTGTQYHEGEITGLTEGLVRLRVECRIGSQISGKDLDLMVELPAEATIQLNKNIPLNEGEVQILLSTDKHLKETPQLTYYYDSNPGRKMTVALQSYENYDKSWIGTVIVPGNNEKTQIVFEYSGTTLKGARSTGIVEGRSFSVDTKPPQRIETIQVESQNSRVIIRWLLEEEDIAYYTVYRSTKNEITPLDFYRNVNTSIVEDMNLSSREYFYSVAGVDKAGNRGPLSRTVSAQVNDMQQNAANTPQITTQDKQRINNTVNDIDRTLLDINGANSDLQRDRSTAGTPREYDIVISENTVLRQELERYRLQLVQLSENTGQDQLSSLLNTLNSRITQIRQEATLKVRTIETSEHLQDINEQNSKGILQDYLAGKRASEEQIIRAQRNLMNTQALFRVDSSLYVVERTRITGEVTYVSTIEKKYTFENPDPIQSGIIIERIPQELQDKTYSTEPKETTKSRGLAQYTVDSLGYTPYVITYRFNERITDTEFKKFHAIIYSEEKTSTTPTGNTILDGSTARSISIVFLIILFSMVGVAGLLYKFGPQLENIKSKLFSPVLSREDDEYLRNIQKLEQENKNRLQNNNPGSTMNDSINSYGQIRNNSSANTINSNQTDSHTTQQSNHQTPNQNAQPVIEVKYLARWQNKEPLVIKNNNLTSVPHIVRELRGMSEAEYSVFRRQLQSWVERNGYSELKDAFDQNEIKSCLKVLKNSIVKY